MEHALDNPKQPDPQDKAVPRRRAATAAESEPHPALELQQRAGNQAMQHLLRSGVIQAKLAVSQPNDPAEQEADRTADRIMRSHAGVGSAATSCSCGTDEEDMCDECRAKQTVARKAEGASPAAAPSSARKIDSVLQSPGRSLDAATRAFFEPRFGRDLSNVRIHSDAAAATSARSIQAHAYAAGDDLVFDTGRFAPETQDGRRLLAHELSHVVQKQKGAEEPSIQRQPNPGGSASAADQSETPALDAGESTVRFQVQVITPEAFQAMTGKSAEELPEGQLVTTATTGAGMGMAMSGMFGVPAAGMAGANAPGPAGSVSVMPGPFDASSPMGRVVAFGLANRSYMDTAEANTGLTAINIQDFNTWDPMMGKPMPPGWPYFPGGPGMEAEFENPARPGGLDPMFSGVMAQEALEGDVAGTAHFDMRGSTARPFELTPALPEGDMPGFSLQDLHSASEARQGIAYLASTGPGERNVTIVIQHEDGVTTITPESNSIEGAPLPEWIASHMPNISNTPEPPTPAPGVPPMEGPVFTPTAGAAASFIRVGGTILMIYGAYRSVERIRNAPEAERTKVELEEGGSWIGGALGSAFGAAEAAGVFCLPAGPADFICVAGGALGGFIMGAVGSTIGRAVGDAANAVGDAIQGWVMDKAAEAYQHQIEQQGDPMPPGSQNEIDEILGPSLF